MYALNRVQIIGYLTQNPEIRQTPNGQTVGDLNVMTRQSFTKSDGATQESKSFHNVVVWRGLADIAGRFLKQGSQVYISGRMQTDEWEDPQGNRRYKTRVVADEMIMLDPREAYASAASGSIAGCLNRAEVLGNMTRDPELRQTPNGASVVSFGVATNFSWKNKAGESQEKTEFHNIVVWGALAQQIHQSIKKGRKVYVAGRVQTRSWETPDGQKKYATEIVADQVMMLGAYDAEIGAPTGAGAVRVTSAVMSAPLPSNGPAEPVGAIPAIDYSSDIKPEDLPF